MGQNFYVFVASNGLKYESSGHPYCEADNHEDSDDNRYDSSLFHVALHPCCICVHLETLRLSWVVAWRRWWWLSRLPGLSILYRRGVRTESALLGRVRLLPGVRLLTGVRLLAGIGLLHGV